MAAGTARCALAWNGTRAPRRPSAQSRCGDGPSSSIRANIHSPASALAAGAIRSRLAASRTISSGASGRTPATFGGGRRGSRGRRNGASVSKIRVCAPASRPPAMRRQSTHQAAQARGSAWYWSPSPKAFQVSAARQASSGAPKPGRRQ